MSERRRIIQQLQEQINQIDEEVEKLNIDRDLHSSMIRELYKEHSERSSDSEEELSELSIEIKPPEREKKPVKSKKKSKRTKAQERKEERDKARAWALDRARARKGK